jgi:hypothetical protein
VRPPLHLVHFVEVDLDVLAEGGGGERPGGVVDADGVGELALETISYLGMPTSTHVFSVMRRLLL